MTTVDLTTEQLQKIIKTPKLRRKLAYESMRYFFAIYLNHYLTFKLAPFHHEFFSLAEDETKKLIVILAFRGSGKSTYFSTCYPIWAITGNLQKKFIVIFTQTQQQAKRLLDNIKKLLEGNEILKSDIGPFEDPNDEWSAMSIVLKSNNARILVASTEQSIRGIRHGQYRPDLIILDDVEDLASVKTQELRDKLEEWYTAEVVPLGITTRDAKFVFVGTRLHEDDLYSRVIRKIKEKRMRGTYRIYPIATGKGKPTWPGKYPNKQSLVKEKERLMSEAAWQREYMLQIIYDDHYIYKPGDFTRYQVMPPAEKLRFILISIDLAISTKSTADKTAMAAAYISGYNKELKAYLAEKVINKKMDFTQTIQEIRNYRDSLLQGIPVYLLVENVAYQQAAIEQLKIEGFTVYPVNPQGEDKRARLTTVSPLVKNATILFPILGTKELEQQLISFGIERYDDLADAFAYLAKRVQEEIVKAEPSIRFI